ncbi:hypothetical protein BJX63DRAFT_337402 [Aspergillus granulosus]|uniref:DUF6594 domain-containing protein n=1 Tax=Aspergillus granulosus TaxID=176169 RepID=A0ABR4HX41_9EURO
MTVPSPILPISAPPRATTEREGGLKKIEEYKAGYPRFTALLSSHTPFFVFRRFSYLRARLLLLQQDKLSILEQRLEQADDQEAAPLFLGNSRRDRNAARATILAEIKTQLADYDQLLERSNHMFALKAATSGDVRSLQNWLDGNGCLAREESAYLEHRRDLVTLASPGDDDATTRLETWVEDKLIRFYRGFRASPYHDISDDPNVYIYSGPWIRRIAKAILLSIIILFLLLPIVVCSMTQLIPVRLAIIAVLTIAYLVVIPLLTKSKTMELMLAGATYATVLTVFISGDRVL